MLTKTELEQDDLVNALQERINQLENIIALMPGHVFWLDRDGIYQGCNNAQAAFLNLASPHEIIGKTTSEILPIPQAADIDRNNVQIMEADVAALCEETDGKSIYLSSKAPLHNQQGDVTGLLGISMDITQRKRDENELREAKKRAEIATQVKTEFIRNMEHDIRTPLCGIIGISNYLKSKAQDPEYEELLQDIEAASTELLEYFNDILEFSQIDMGTTPIILKEFNLKEAIQSIIRMELPAIKDKNIKLYVEYPDNIPHVITSDKFRINRALLNLVSNAIKFTNIGTIKIRVSLGEKTGINAVLKIAIIDTGIGIAKNNQEMIFDKFTRCDPTNRGLYKGTGLGLWIVKQFMDELGGKINLESEPGKGSTFTLLVPIQIP